MFNATTINQLLIPSVLIVCLVVGYCWKKLTAFEAKSHDLIPTALSLLGMVLTCFTLGWSLDHIAQGLITGLASTGLHQAFTRFIEGMSDKQQNDE